MARKRNPAVQEQPTVNRVQGAFDGGKSSIPPSVRRKMKEQAENGDFDRLTAPITMDEKIAAYMLRVDRVKKGLEQPDEVFHKLRAEIAAQTSDQIKARFPNDHKRYIEALQIRNDAEMAEFSAIDERLTAIEKKSPKYGSLMRVSDAFADDVRVTAANAGVPMAEFCDKFLGPLVRAFRYEMVIEEAEKLRGDYTATLHVRSLLNGNMLRNVEGETLPVRALIEFDDHKVGDVFNIPATDYSYRWRRGFIEPIEPVE